MSLDLVQVSDLNEKKYRFRIRPDRIYLTNLNRNEEFMSICFRLLPFIFKKRFLIIVCIINIQNVCHLLQINHGLNSLLIICILLIKTVP